MKSIGKLTFEIARLLCALVILLLPFALVYDFYMGNIDRGVRGLLVFVGTLVFALILSKANDRIKENESK